MDKEDHVKAGDQLTEGSKNPREVLRIQGRDACQMYLLEEVQKVYRSQGVNIHDKHIEIIIRQMLRKVRVRSTGDSEFLPGELVDRFTFEEENEKIMQKGGTPARGETVLLGITKAALNTESFLAAASFQETTRVLTEAAIKGAKDELRGLKENVIIGKLIPVGTGFEERLRRAREAEAQKAAAAQREREATTLLGEVPSSFSGGLGDAPFDASETLLSTTDADADGDSPDGSGNGHEPKETP